MSKIRILPEALANKIAAGEVVERPASVVKELLENSLDAGAATLEIEIEAGGRRLIRVMDDGEGMTSDDALLAFERHATSKLQRTDDLSEIATLGFRGEALPSIASVSRLLLETRHETEEIGTTVEINGAKLSAVKKIARTRGTSITVRDLFFNVPARKKFLKSESTELGHIVNFVTQYALAHPEGRFLLRSGEHEVFNFQPVELLRERVFQVFGGDLLNQLVEVRADLPIFYQEESESEEPKERREWIRVHGFVSKPEVQKLNRNSLYFFVNRRMVRDRIILHAIAEAYRNILPSGIYPVVLLFIEIPFAEVDVNVHPSKIEVRFRRQTLIHDFLRDAVRKTLVEARPQATFPASRQFVDRSRMDSPFDGPPIEALPLSPTQTDEWPASSHPSFSDPASVTQTVKAREPFALTPLSSSPTTSTLPFRPEEESPGPSSGFVSGEGCSAASPIRTSPMPANAGLQSLSGIIPMGQIDNSFIIASDQGALLIIDQHVAHERILFEKVLGQRNQGTVESQRLLLPIIVELSPRQQVILEDIMPELEACGFDVEPFGRKTIAIKSAPADLKHSDVEQLLAELLESLEKETQSVNFKQLREKIAASIACHAAIKINMHLDHTKMVWLIEELQKTQIPMNCPHGRPIILRYDKKEILKAFKRL
jgi:DNA mismatch repair protein MutL